MNRCFQSRHVIKYEKKNVLAEIFLIRVQFVTQNRRKNADQTFHIP